MWLADFTCGQNLQYSKFVACYYMFSFDLWADGLAFPPTVFFSGFGVLMERRENPFYFYLLIYMIYKNHFPQKSNNWYL